jgi:hypothetical protein
MTVAERSPDAFHIVSPRVLLTVARGFLRPDDLPSVTGRSLDQSGARSPQRAGRSSVHG